MARIRTVKPEFWEDEVVGTLSLGARLLFVATWNVADDEGLLRWAPAYLKAAAFIYDDLSDDQLTVWMDELTSARLVFPYLGGKGKQQLGFIVKFRKHQKINRAQPGRLPPPSIQNSKVRTMYAFRDGFECGICHQPIADEWGDDGPSLDHIMSKAEGGSHYPSNIQIAHLRCNKSKRDKPIGHSVSDSVNDSLNHSRNEAVTRDGSFSESFSESFTDGREVEVEGIREGIREVEGEGSSREAVNHGAADTEPHDQPIDQLVEFCDAYPLACEILAGLKHPGGTSSTRATFRARYLYEDDSGDEILGDPVLKGLDIEDRKRLLAGALLEYRDQGNGTWERPHFTGFLKRLRDQEAMALPPPQVRYASTEPEPELTDEQRDETARAIREAQEERAVSTKGSEKKPGRLTRSLGPKVPEAVDDPALAAEHEAERDRQRGALQKRMADA